MTVGFTGTRKGMNASQLLQLDMLLQIFYNATALGPDEANEFHHGGAVGADRDATACAREWRYAIHCHPTFGVTRDEQDPYINDRWHEVFPPLVRNRRIVESCQILIAAPATDEEQLRSGTWATVRYAAWCRTSRSSTAPCCGRSSPCQASGLRRPA